MNAILSLIPWSWRIAIVACAALVLCGSFGVGVRTGYDAGKAKGEAEVAKLRADYNQRAARAEQENAEIYLNQSLRLIEIQGKYYKEKSAHEATRITLEKRIDAATRNSNRVIDDELVRLYNEAIGAVAAGDNAEAGGHTGRTPQGTGTAVASGPRLHRAVTVRDALRHAAYAGQRYKDMAAQLAALIQAVKEESACPR